MIKRILLILCFHFLYSTCILHAETAGVSKTRAAYWGIKSVEQGKEQLQLLKKYGFNTALVKDGSYRLREDLWREWGNIAGGHNLQFFPVLNFRGHYEIKYLQQVHTPYVNRHGTVFPATPCPLDVNYWNASIGQRFGQLAHLSISTPIAGLIFDTEMYGSDMSVYNDFCFCDTCWQEFVKAEHLDVPELNQENRFEYLIQQNLLQRYSTFQENRLQDILSHIETQVHRINPHLSLGFLAYLNNWFYTGLIRGLGTTDKPVMVFSESSYVRGYTPYVTKEKRTIKEKSKGERREMKGDRRAGISDQSTARYIPGLWLGRFFPEDIPSQLYTLATHTDGYWIFTADSLWADGQNTGAYALHGSRTEYWAALKKANDELLQHFRDPDSFRSELLPVYLSSFYDTSQNRLVTQPSLKHFMHNIIPSQIRRLPESNAQNIAKITYRGKTLFHCLKNMEGTIYITHVPLAKYTDHTRYKLFDSDGFLLQEGSLNKHKPSVQITLPQNVSGIVSLLTDSGANTTQVSFFGLPYIVEASSTFSLSTINTAHTYTIYVKPEKQRLRLRAYCSGQETASLTVRSPDNNVHRKTRVTGFTEINVRVTENISPNDQNFWMIAVNPVLSKPFEDIQFYFYNEEFPYILTKDFREIPRP